MDALAQCANELPNLQLLEGAINNEKRAAMPAEWLRTHHPDLVTQENYKSNHQLGELSANLQDFEGFHSARRERLRGLLTSMLSLSAVSVVEGEAPKAP